MKSSSNQKIPTLFSPLLKTDRFPWLVLIVGLGLIGFLAFFWNLGTAGLLDETETSICGSLPSNVGDWGLDYPLF